MTWLINLHFSSWHIHLGVVSTACFNEDFCCCYFNEMHCSVFEFPLRTMTYKINGMNISQSAVILNVFPSLRISSYCISLILCVHLSPGTDCKRVFQLESCQERRWLLCFPPISYFHMSAKQWPKHGDECALTNTVWLIKWMNALIMYLSGYVCFMIQFNVKTLEKKTRLTEVLQQVRGTSFRPVHVLSDFNGRQS